MLLVLCFFHYSQLSIMEKPLVLSTPFPHFLPWKQTASQQPRSMLAKDSTWNYSLMQLSSPFACPAGACSSLQSHSGLRRPLQELCNQLQNVNLRLAPSFTESNCLDRDGYQELCAGLETLANCYRTSSPSECSTDDET